MILLLGLLSIYDTLNLFYRLKFLKHYNLILNIGKIMYIYHKMKSILKRIIGFGGFSNGESLLIYALILLIIFGPWLFTQSCFQDIAFGPEAAWVDDTIGGITTPFLNLLAAFFSI